MAELCRKCFIEIWHPSAEDISNIVMSKDSDICEGCMNWGPYVDHIKADPELTDEESLAEAKELCREMQDSLGVSLLGKKLWKEAACDDS